MIQGDEVIFNVPLLSQYKVYPHAPKSNMACWYTSGYMILLFRMGITSVASTLQIDSLKRLHDNSALAYGDVGKFSREFGFEVANTSVKFRTKGAGDWSAFLKQAGPIWACYRSHVVVVTGCFRNVAGQPSIAVNDPALGKKTFLIEEFNRQINWNLPMLFRSTTYFLKRI